MDRSTDWESAYQQGETPWDKGEPAPGLVDFLAAHPDLGGGQVCVPGCGIGHDARALASAGFDVTAIDLAPTAIERGQKIAQEMGLRVRFVRGDFLNMGIEGEFDWLFEHTFLSAIDPAKREQYEEVVRRAIRPSGYFLAIHFLIPDQDEPPFGISRAEVLERFEPHFELLAEWVPRSWPNRVNEERMFWWKRR